MNRKSLLLFSFFAISCSTPSSQDPVATRPAQNQSAEPVQMAPVVLETNIDKFAFGSCSHQKQAQPIWETVSAQKPQLFIAMGDNVYASRPEDKPIGEQYRMQSLVPEFRKFRAQVPIIGVWDDHDFGKNDGGADNPEKDEAKAEYIKFFPADAARLSPYQKGVYHSFTFGQAPRRVQVIMLDTRYFRTPLEKNPNPRHKLDIFQPTKDPNQAILGDEQWAWFESELKLPAEVRFIVSSIQVIPEEHGFEKWANFPKERKRFFDLLKKTKATNVVLLSGDRHMAEISRQKFPGIGEIVEVTASAINRPSSITEEPNTHRIGNFYPQANFGLASIDWEKQNLTLQILDLKGEKMIDVSQKISLPKQTKPSR